MQINDDSVLVKFKSLGLSEKDIAKRMGITQEELKKRWDNLTARAQSLAVSGYKDLADQFTILAHQYQLMGESLKPIAMALGNIADPDEVLKCIAGTPQDTLVNLLKNFIVLRPYVAQEAAQALEAALKQHSSGN